MERRRIRKEKKKDLEKKKADLKKVGKSKSGNSKTRSISKKHAIILIAIVISAIVIPILIFFLTPTTASSFFTESDSIIYSFENNNLTVDYVNCKYFFAVTGAVIDAGIKDKFDFTLMDSNASWIYTGDVKTILNSTSGQDQDYTVGGIPNIDFNFIRINDGLMNFPCSIWWNHNLTNTDLDSYKNSHLFHYVGKPELITSSNPYLGDNLTNTQNLSVKLSITGGSDLTGFEQIDMLRMSFGFKNQLNVTFANPIAINASIFSQNDELTFYKVVYNIKANEIITLEFNVTINCLNNLTNVNILDPIQDTQIVIQFKDKLMNDIYSTHSTLGAATLERINDISNKAKEAWNNLARLKYLNLLIKVPLIYNATIYN